MVGEVIKKAREGYGFSIRELARRAGVSAAQISRIESGAVDQPAVDTLIAVARALDRNPKPLLIVSRHISGDEARAVLATMFREHAGQAYDPEVDSELVDEWAHGWERKLAKARELLAQPEIKDEKLRRLAGDVFLTAETEETLWWDSWLGPLLQQEGGEELRTLVGYWQLLPPARKLKVLEYASEQVELSRPERLGLLARDEDEAG